MVIISAHQPQKSWRWRFSAIFTLYAQSLLSRLDLNSRWPLTIGQTQTINWIISVCTYCKKALFRTGKSLTTSLSRVKHHLLSKNIKINHWPGWIQQQLVVFWPPASSRSSSTWTALRPFSNSHLTDGLRHCSTYMCPFYQSANQRPVVSWNHNEIHAAPLLVHFRPF